MNLSLPKATQTHKEDVNNCRLRAMLQQWTRKNQPRPQDLLAFQYGGGRRREDPSTQRTKTIADWRIPLRVHT